MKPNDLIDLPRESDVSEANHSPLPGGSLDIIQPPTGAMMEWISMPYVLVVDDEEPIRKLLARWLTGWGYESKEASNADEAIDLMNTEAAAIILCDVMMPVHDGIWLAEQVRTRWPQTAVIMASSAQDMETVMRMRKQGAIDYVTKPFGREMLRQALLRANEKIG